jgi:hypothetical protein
VVITGKGIKNTSMKPPSVTSGRGKVRPVLRPSPGRIFRTLLLSLTLALLVLPGVSGQWYSDYYYRKLITIPADNVTGTGSHTNFPVLIDETHDDLKSASNEGLVQSEDGYDIVFTASDGTTLLNHEVESYDAVTGHLIAWVQIPSLSTSSDNYLYLYYGKPGIMTDPSTPDTWDPDAYVAVYHLHDDFADASGNNPDATNQGSTNTGGLIADAQDFQQGDNTDRVELGNLIVTNDSLTISAWIRPSPTAIPDARIVSKADGTADANHWWMLSAVNYTDLRFRLKTGGTTITYAPANHVLVDNIWQYHHGSVP